MSRGGIPALQQARQALRDAHRAAATAGQTAGQVTKAVQPVAAQGEHLLDGSATGIDGRVRAAVIEAGQALTEAAASLAEIRPAVDAEIADLDRRIEELLRAEDSIRSHR